MIINFDKLYTEKEELIYEDRTNPYIVAGLFANISTSYNPSDDSNFIDMLQYLMGDNQPISALIRQQIKDRMTQNDKYKYIGNSYFIGSTPSNDYTPNIPYQIEVLENEYSRQEEGYVRLFLKSGGADNPRPITVRLAKDGNYYIWSDSFLGILSDIRPLESTNPWA